MKNLQKGAVYSHECYGLIEYQRIDTFANQRNFDFRQVSTGRSKLLSADEVEVMLSQQETIESVKQQRDGYIASLQVEVLPVSGLNGVTVMKSDHLPSRTMVLSPDLFEVMKGTKKTGGAS